MATPGWCSFDAMRFRAAMVNKHLSSSPVDDDIENTAPGWRVMLNGKISETFCPLIFCSLSALSYQFHFFFSFCGTNKYSSLLILFNFKLIFNAEFFKQQLCFQKFSQFLFLLFGQMTRWEKQNSWVCQNTVLIVSLLASLDLQMNRF